MKRRRWFRLKWWLRTWASGLAYRLGYRPTKLDWTDGSILPWRVKTIRDIGPHGTGEDMVDIIRCDLKTGRYLTARIVGGQHVLNEARDDILTEWIDGELVVEWDGD